MSSVLYRHYRKRIRRLLRSGTSSRGHGGQIQPFGSVAEGRQGGDPHGIRSKPSDGFPSATARYSCLVACPGSLLASLAEISITLGRVNLLPVPGLDGGQILFEPAQWARGISEEHSEMSVAGRVQGDVECGRVPGDRPAAGKRSRAEDECRRL